MFDLRENAEELCFRLEDEKKRWAIGCRWCIVERIVAAFDVDKAFWKVRPAVCAVEVMVALDG